MPVKNREALAKELCGVSLDTLEDTPGRALDFLRAAGTNLAIFTSLCGRGYSALVHREGWTKLSASSSIGIVADDSEIAPEVAAAVAKVDEQDEVFIRIIRATWKRRFPEQASFVLRDMQPATRMEAVLNMSTILDGLTALESSPDRASTRDQDGQALALLAKRGLGAELRAEIAGWVEKAKSVPQSTPMSPEDLAQADEAYVRALGDLRAWYEEWSEIAKVVIKRRDRLMQLGLAHARQREVAEPETEEPAPGGGGVTPTA